MVLDTRISGYVARIVEQLPSREVLLSIVGSINGFGV
jgi:hypothetical protein